MKGRQQMGYALTVDNGNYSVDYDLGGINLKHAKQQFERWRAYSDLYYSVALWQYDTDDTRIATLAYWQRSE